jgi:ATP/maltotriose-dependent transcriptional regulator MalT
MTMPNLFTYILKQLLLHRALSTTTGKLLPYQRKPPARPSEAEILSLLCEEIKTYDRVYVVLDALDESRNDIAIKVRYSLIHDLPDNVSLLCTSRRIPEIEKTFAGDQLFDITANNEDMRKYVEAFFEDTTGLCDLVARTHEVDQETITSKVLERARGM